MLTPRLAILLSSADIDGANQFVRRYIRHCAALSLAILLGIVLFGSTILETIFGKQYALSYAAMVVMSGAFFLEVLTGPKAGVMNMMGKQYLTALLAFIGIALNAAIDILFLESYGFIVAAYGTLISSVFIGVTMAVYCKKKLGVVSYLS